MKLNLTTRIGMGYAIVTILLIGAVATTLVEINSTQALITEMSAPEAQASVQMLGGMNHSLAALRGWIILGKDTFKLERTDSWSHEIEPGMELLVAASKDWTNPQRVEHLQAIRANLDEFKNAQTEIEDIPQTNKNVPAIELLFTEAAPEASIMTTCITEMIDLEGKLPATVDRKALLGMMADVRGTTGLALANIRAYLLSGDEAFKVKYDKLWAKNTARFGDLETNAHLLSDEQTVALRKFSSARMAFISLPPRMFELRAADDWNLANFWLGKKAAPRAQIINKNLHALNDLQNEEMDQNLANARSQVANLARIEWIMMIIGIFTSIIIGFLVTRSIVNPVNEIIVGLQLGSDEVASASGQTAQSSTDMAEGASVQAARIEETSATLDELSKAATRNLDTAHEANKITGDVQGETNQGRQAMTNMTDAINRIKQSSDETSNIIKTIDEIAFQTNLLALNAAVEAARAGDAGKGFAVVAEEVRNLAQRSANAARTTSDLIAQSTQNAEDGVRMTTDVSKILDGIVTGITQLSNLIQDVTSASEEQAGYVGEISSAVRDMDEITQSNAAKAEESASASEQLSAQAVELGGMVSDLIGLVEGVNETPKNNAGSFAGSQPSQHTGPGTTTSGVASHARITGSNEIIPLTEDDFLEV